MFLCLLREDTIGVISGRSTKRGWRLTPEPLKKTFFYHKWKNGRKKPEKNMSHYWSREAFIQVQMVIKMFLCLLREDTYKKVVLLAVGPLRGGGG